MDKSDIVEINSICRLCVKLLETEKVSPIFSNENNEQISLPERIWYCSSIQVYEGDGLPSHICSYCLLKLNQSFVFRNQCILADNTLKRLTKNDHFSLSDLPDFVDDDLENKIILQDKENLTNNSSSEIENNSIDEFDNSKNGRHKRNINKTKDRLLQKGKICNGLESGNLSGIDSSIEFQKDNVSDLSLHENEKLECSTKKKKVRLKVKKSLSKIKENLHFVESIERIPGKENKIKIKQSKKLRAKRVNGESEEGSLKEEIKVEIKEENMDHVEDFTVEPDLFDFNEGKKEFDFKEDEDDDDEDFKETKKKVFKKLTREKSGGTRRGRPRKYPVVKEKPPYYTCEYCQKIYPSEGGWRYHIHTMHNENYQPFICDLCGKAFKVKKNLEGHKNSVHYHLKQHLCDLCGRGFASKYALKVHKIWHNDEKNFPCDICGTKFRTRGKMNTHRSIHGGPKKFMCHVCSRDFRWKKDFEIHMRTHTGEKPFKCSLCGKAFSSLTNMKKHERNHAGKFGTLNGSEVIETTAIPMLPDERLYKQDLPFSFNYSVDDIRNRPVE